MTHPYNANVYACPTSLGNDERVDMANDVEDDILEVYTEIYVLERLEPTVLLI